MLVLLSTEGLYIVESLLCGFSYELSLKSLSCIHQPRVLLAIYAAA